MASILFNGIHPHAFAVMPSAVADQPLVAEFALIWSTKSAGTFCANVPESEYVTPERAAAKETIPPAKSLTP